MPMTKFPGGTLSGNEVRKTGTYTVVSNTDAGKHFIFKDTTVVTLPAIAIGNTFKFIFDGADNSATITLSPNSADGIAYKGSQTDDKDLILTAANAKRGDFVILAALDQTVSWQVTDVRGVWTKES